MKTFRAVLALALTVALLPACGEKPQRLEAQGDSPVQEQWDGQLRDRTLMQGESARMGY